MAHAQKPDLVVQRNGRVHLNRRGSQFSRLLAVEECGSAGRPWIDHVPRHSARVVATLSIRLFPLHFPSHASPCAITFRKACTECQYIQNYITAMHSVTKHVLELKLTKFFAVTKPGCANHERVNCRTKKGIQAVHGTVTLYMKSV